MSSAPLRTCDSSPTWLPNWLSGRIWIAIRPPLCFATCSAASSRRLCSGKPVGAVWPSRQVTSAACAGRAMAGAASSPAADPRNHRRVVRHMTLTSKPSPEPVS
jgi:hypothetical protein